MKTITPTKTEQFAKSFDKQIEKIKQTVLNSDKLTAEEKHEVIAYLIQKLA